jgi:hypothetical protein
MLSVANELIMMSVDMLNVVMLTVIMLTVIMLTVVMLTVVAPSRAAFDKLFKTILRIRLNMGVP